MHPPKLTLTLRPHSDTRRDADAWFITGDSADVWLNALLKSGASTRTIRFRLLRNAAGSLIGSIVTGVECNPAADWLPYARVAERLFVPVGGQIFPGVSDVEIRELLTSETIHEFVWHPSIGLVGFEQQQILATHDLFTIPARNSSDWTRAEPGMFLNSRLVSVLPTDDLTPDLIFEDGRDDIGADSDDISSAPPSSDESPAAGLQDLAAKMLSPFARAARWLADRSTSSAGSPTWLSSVGSWAERILSRAVASQSKRLNEMRRLLSMLDKDPDRGLRYALPFGGDAHRGVARPSNQLAPHGVDFGGGGGGAADYWHMPPEIAAELLRRYRELAQREVKLGRYRRAAYIYAALLNDYHSAAQVLVDGGFFREAAEVYRRRLKQPRQAAECLLRAGLWPEAIEIFEELKDWVTVAETYEKLDDHDAAHDAWQKAASSLEQEREYIRAANIHEKHLLDYDAAAELLERGWKSLPAGSDCLSELFGLFGRTENHGASAECIERLATDEMLPVTRQNDVADVMAELTQAYPDGKIRATAFNHGRMIVARNLALTDSRIRHRVLKTLEKLIPDDQLLRRDCRRYDQQSASQKTRYRAGQMRCFERISLRSDVTWQAATCTRNRAFVAGFVDDSLVLATWTFRHQPVIEYRQWYLRKERQTRILLAPATNQADTAYLHITGMQTDEMDDLFRSGRSTWHVRALPFSERAVQGVGVGNNGTVWSVNIYGAAIEIRGNQETGSPITARTLPVSCSTFHPLSFIHPFSEFFKACVVENSLVVVRPSELTVNKQPRQHPDRFVVDTASFGGQANDGAGLIEEFELPDMAAAFAAFDELGLPRVAIMFEEGGLVHWLKSSHQQSFGQGLIHPAATFMTNEDLVVADAQGKLEIYRTRHEQLALIATHKGTESRPIAVLPSHNMGTGSTHEFLVCHCNGTVDVFEYQS